jgi:hypothetical protein
MFIIFLILINIIFNEINEVKWENVINSLKGKGVQTGVISNLNFMFAVRTGVRKTDGSACENTDCNV